MQNVDFIGFGSNTVGVQVLSPRPVSSSTITKVVSVIKVRLVGNNSFSSDLGS
ncbi:MAG: hypothetical protein ACRBBP_11100 [Bdellovibrionales bacterium]